MNRQIEVTYTEAMVRSATRRFLLGRLIQQRIILLLIVLCVAAIFFLTSISPTPTRYDTLVNGAVLGSLALAAGIVVVAWWWAPAGAARSFGRLDAWQARFDCQQEYLEITNAVGVTKLPWHTFDELWKHRDMWFLVFNKHRYFILPAEKLSPALGAWIEGRIRENGGKVR